MVFQDKKQEPKKSKNMDCSVTILTPGCHFNGKLYCRGSSRIGGRIEGEIVSEGLLIIEEEALITANIRAEEVIIQGCVEGSLIASGKVELTSSAKFIGTIQPKTLVIHEGASFQGSCIMDVPANDVKSEKLLSKEAIKSQSLPLQ